MSPRERASSVTGYKCQGRQTWNYERCTSQAKIELVYVTTNLEEGRYETGQCRLHRGWEQSANQDCCTHERRNQSRRGVVMHAQREGWIPDAFCRIGELTADRTSASLKPWQSANSTCTSRAMAVKDPHQEKLGELVCCGRADIRVSQHKAWRCS